MINSRVGLCFSVVIAVVWCYPPVGYRNGYYHPVPKRSVMFGGYYSNPLLGGEYDSVPQGSMTAMVSGNTVATNSYSGTKPQWRKEPLPHPSAHIQPSEEENETFFEAVTEKRPPRPAVVIKENENEGSLPETSDQEQEQENDEQDLAVSTEAAIVTSTRKAKTPKRLSTAAASTKKRIPQKEEVDQVQEEESDDVESSWPFGSRKGGPPSYMTFFPIMIGGQGIGGQRRRSSGNVQADDSGYDSGSYPGSATAIANSFSTGKGGVATSHATSFGDPFMAARFFRSLEKKGTLNGVQED